MEHPAVYIYLRIYKRFRLSAGFSAIFICLNITFPHNENLLSILMRKENV